MNILFLTLLDFDSIEEHNIYTDLLREFTKCNYQVFVISPVERRKKQKTRVLKEKNTTILKLKIGNIQKINLIEKGISTIKIEPQFIFGIKKYFSDVKFDLVIYSTPPITFCNAISFIKKRDNAKTYLLLKDIFPQNAVDMGMMSKTGFKSILYKFFRKKEKKLYDISDRIGCMSQANVNYIVKHNKELDSRKVEICPNSIEVIDKSLDENEKVIIRNKYKIPINKKVFIYGGNLGRPQGIDFLIKCIASQKNNKEVFFLIIGDGTEYKKLENYIIYGHQENLKLLRKLDKNEYDTLVASCDIGLIFLDYRFTIPNFPSRILSYMQAKLPVLACTDPNTDLGNVIAEGGFGWWCESNNVEKFKECINKLTEIDIKKMGDNAWKFLCEKYNVDSCVRIILNENIA